VALPLSSSACASFDAYPGRTSVFIEAPFYSSLNEAAFDYFTRVTAGSRNATVSDGGVRKESASHGDRPHLVKLASKRQPIRTSRNR
jgi:hypothetical protein